MTRHKPPEAALAPSPAAAITPPGFLAEHFHGPTWNRWRVILRAAWGEKLNAKERALFREVAGDRDPPAGRVKELWAIAGRWSGKDSIASAIACVAACTDWRGHLRPGEVPVVLCLASDREQAQIVRKYTVGYFSENPLLREMVARETEHELDLKSGVSIVVGTANYRAVRGRTVVCAVLDEVGVWKSETTMAPDIETYSALTPALARIPGSMLIGISTPFRRRGLLYERWQKYYRKNDPNVLVVAGASPLFNPKVPQSLIDEELARDPERAGAEWLAEWRSDLSDFLDRGLIDAAVVSGVVVRPPQRGFDYVAFCDSAGGRGDSFTAAIAHAEDGGIVLDALYERRPPFNPADVVAEVAALLRSYGVNRVTGDRYSAEWVIGAFAKDGINYRQTAKDRSAIYAEVLPLFTSGRARLLDNARLVHQFVSLERRTGAAGKDRINHPDGGADDLANATAGALLLASTDAQPTLIAARDLLINDGAAPLPKVIQAFLAVLVVGEDGRMAVTYLAVPPDPVFGPVVLVDFEAGQFSPAIFGIVAMRLETMTREACGNGRRPIGAFLVEGPHINQARDAMVLRFCDPVLDWGGRRDGRWDRFDLAKVTKGDAMRALLLNVGARVGEGRVKLGADAVEKAKRHPLGSALSLHLGEADASPLRLSFLVAVNAIFPPGSSFRPPDIPATRIG